MALPGPTIISTAVPTASAERIFRFDGPTGAGDAGGPTVESIDAVAVGATAWARFAGPGTGLTRGGGGGGGFDTTFSFAARRRTASLLANPLCTSEACTARGSVLDTPAVEIRPLAIAGAFEITPAAAPR